MNRADSEAARDEGIAQSSESSGEKWKLYAIRFLKWYCTRNQTVFVDDLWEAGLDKPSSPRALGAVMQHAVKEGWISELTYNGCVLAKPSVASHMQLKRVWKSEVYRKPSYVQGELL